MSDWIMKISGIIVLGAICNEIMVEGELKKYLKLVVGLVLTLVFVQPFADGFGKIPLELPDSGRKTAVVYTKDLKMDEKELLMNAYNQKLAQIVEKGIWDKWGIATKATVKTEEKQEKNFGGIVSITLEISGKGEVDKKDIRNYICEEFGVLPEKIHMGFR